MHAEEREFWMKRGRPCEGRTCSVPGISRYQALMLYVVRIAFVARLCGADLGDQDGPI